MQLYIIVSEVSQKKIPYGITYTWNPKYGTNECNYETEKNTDKENKLVVASGDGRGMDGTSVLHIESINKVLPLGTILNILG